MLASTWTGMPSSTNGSSRLRAQALGDGLGRGDVAASREHDGELVAAEAREQVLGARAWLGRRAPSC